MATTTAGEHSDELAEFGYKQELDRSIGRFASFAAGVSYISILTGVFQLFYFGFAFGGPAYWWTWPMVFVGQLMVALCFAELAANFPVAGSIYNWGKMLATATVAWLGGWMMLTASIVTIAAVALAYQITLPEISDFFQFYGDGTGENDFAINAVILGTVLIIFTTLINALGVKLMSRINSTGVFIELIAAVVLIVALARQRHARSGRGVRDAGHRRGPRVGLLRRLPRRLARLGLRDVRLRHRELSRRGDPRAAQDGAARDHARRDRLVRPRRADHPVRDDGRGQHQRARDRRVRRPPVHHPRRLRRHGREDLPDLRGDRRDGLLPRRPHRDDPHGVRDGARQQPAGR